MTERVANTLELVKDMRSDERLELIRLMKDNNLIYGELRKEAIHNVTERPIEEILMELASQIPEEDWDAIPNDLSENLDHYLYGIDKR
ncbi:MAG: hypothetical protein P9X24_15235 [Candidatus Hatepunaea meridiana]|nr:hypothetical protein [Candidatus Hatepunaea meridiana]